MADGRILHRSVGDSAKIAALSDLEYRVWTQYLLSADDHGVMPAEAVKLQSDNRSLRARTKTKIDAAIRVLLDAGLVKSFGHQGQVYLYQPDWKEWQYIRYPRKSIYPAPPAAPETSHEKAQSLGEVSTESPQHAGAGGRETLTPTLTPTVRDLDLPKDRGTAIARPSRPDRSGLAGYHHNCPPGTWAACGRGFCVPGFVAAEWRQSAIAAELNADAEIRACVEAALEKNPGVLAGDKPKFWRAAWALRHGDAAQSMTQPPRRLSKAEESIAAGQRVLARMAEAEAK